MRFATALIQILLLVLAPPAAAVDFAPFRACIRAKLQVQIDYVRDGHLSEADRAQVKAIVERQDLDPRQKAR